MTAETLTTIDDGLRERVPRARCHACGETRIAALCCNCARFLCAKHDKGADLLTLLRKLNSLVPRRPFRSRTQPGPAPAAAPDARPPGLPGSGATNGTAKTAKETDGPPGDDRTDALERIPAPERRAGRPAPPDDEGPDERGAADRPWSPAEPVSVQQRHFCAKCVPVGSHDAQLIGAVVGCVVGALALLLVDTVLGAVVLGASLLWLALRLVTGLRRRRRRERRVQRLLFLDPLIKKLELTETITGRYRLDPATLVVRKVAGTLDVRLAWTRGHAAKADRWRRRHKGAGGDALHAEAGHLVLRGPGQPQLVAPDGCEVTHPARVRLQPKLDDQPWLAGPDGGGDALWNFQLTYDPLAPEGGWRLPMWVTPSITPDSERRSLDLRIQWRTAEPLADPDDPPPLTMKEVTSVYVDVPAAWGTVHQVTTDDVEQTVVGFAADGRTRIEWRKPKIAATQRGECVLSVSFDRPIDQDAAIDGKLEATFAEAVSGTEGVRMYAADGVTARSPR